MSEDKKVCITGASGYLASWAVKYFLEEGWTVHATLRDIQNPLKAGHLHRMAEDYPGMLKFFSADLLDPASLRAAMEGCMVVAHMASPFINSGVRDPERELIRPAVSGTENVLKAAGETPAVRRIVLTSSVAAMYSDASDMDGKTSFTEKDWNTTASLTYQPYSYSKTLAEKKAWEMAGAQDQWDLVVINPGFILGPSLTKRNDSESIKFMTHMGNGVFRTGTADIWFAMVDVRDVATAHVAAATLKEAGGRHILVNECHPLSHVAEVLRGHFGKEYPFPTSVMPNWLVWLVGPFFGLQRKFLSRHTGKPLAFDNANARKRLGLSFRPLDQTIIEHFQQILDDGIIRKR